MTRRLAAVAVALAALCAGAGSARAANGSRPGASCGSTSAAINQYCENIPSSNGAGTPAPGTPASAVPNLGAKLPSGAARAYRRLPAGARKRARRLLTLPAPTGSAPLTGSIAAGGHGWPVPLGVILAMVAVALAGAAAAVMRRRGGGGSGGGSGSGSGSAQ